jgi:hypothetical protein
MATPEVRSVGRQYDLIVTSIRLGSAISLYAIDLHVIFLRMRLWYGHG